MERLSFYIDKKITYVQVERTSNKNMYIKVKDEKVVVYAPKKVSLQTINDFVSKHIDSFIKYIEESKMNKLYSINEKFIFLNGKKYSFNVLTGFNESTIKVSKNNVYIQCKTGSNEEIEIAIKTYLKDFLLKYISKHCNDFEEMMNVPHHTFKVSYKSSNWGVNYVNKRRIILSSRLSHYSNEVIKYVIIHELAHHFFPHHQSNFWNLVKKYIPNYKELRDKLKSNKSMEE